MSILFCRNYVVQIILDQEIPWATDAILDQLQGRFGDLSMQKYSSNVVEKCLKLARDIGRAKIIRELMNSYDLPQIMLDQYGNYVIQSALRECKVKTEEKEKESLVNISIFTLPPWNIENNIWDPKIMRFYHFNSFVTVPLGDDIYHFFHW